MTTVDSDEHFSEVPLRLKQVDLSAAGDVERYVFAATLGTYGLEDKAEDATAAVRAALGEVDVEFDPTPARRFAGDRTLPRTRYHALVQDELDSDDRTLLREMSAYLGSYPGLASLFDTTGANSMEILGVLADLPQTNYRSLDISRPSLLVALRPLEPDPVLAEAYGSGGHYAVQFPFQLSVRTHRDVIDLRRPAAQAWLVDCFSSEFPVGKKRFPVASRRKATAFPQLLPTLLDQWLGAGWTTANLTGVFARQAGAAGLVYPSARSNPFLGLERGAVAAWSDWCFIDYEGAPEMELQAAVSIAGDDWPSAVGFAPAGGSWVKEFIPLRGTEIRHEQSGPRAGSWEVTGVAEYNTAIYRLRQVTAVLSAIDEEVGADAAGNLSYMALYSTAVDIAALVRDMRGALLGHRGSMDVLEDRHSAAGSEFEAETLAKVRGLVSRVPESFRATGELATAWGFG